MMFSPLKMRSLLLLKQPVTLLKRKRKRLLLKALKELLKMLQLANKE
jgi:hypothetical protein